MKKHVVYLAFASFLSLFFVLNFINKPTLNKGPSASWVEVFAEYEDIVDNSDLIALGTVQESIPEKREDLIFTIHHFKISKYYHGKKIDDGTIKITQTGGELNNEKTNPFPEAPLLEQTKQYLVFLKKAPNGNYFAVGGFQGIVEIAPDQKIKVTQQNTVLLKYMKNKNLLDIEKSLKKNKSMN